MALIAWAITISIGINLLMFVPAFIYKTDKLTDISYAITFAVIAGFGYVASSKTFGQLVVLICVLAWSLRLGSFLFIRINKIKRDKRFDGMRENFGRFLRFWVLQGISVFVILLAAILYWSNDGSTLGLMSWAGLIIFVSGLVLEATADMQKFSFNNNLINKGKWIEGVWRLSRHPNYLGEIMVWSGLYIVVFMALSTSQRLIGLASPLFITSLLLFVSGIPMLEKSAEKRWGNQKQYQDYRRKVPVLLPTISSIKRSLFKT